MRSSSVRLDKRRRTYVRMIGEVRHELNQALTEEHARRGLTQAEMARILDCDKSFISRCLNGTRNMTFETLAELAYALDRPVKISIPPRGASGKNHFIPNTTSSMHGNSGPVQAVHRVSYNASPVAAGSADASTSRREIKVATW